MKEKKYFDDLHMLFLWQKVTGKLKKKLRASLIYDTDLNRKKKLVTFFIRSVSTPG